MGKVLPLSLQTGERRHHPGENEGHDRQIGRRQRRDGHGEPDQRGEGGRGADAERRLHRGVRPPECHLTLPHGGDRVREVPDMPIFHRVALDEFQAGQRVGHGSEQSPVGAGQVFAQPTGPPDHRRGEEQQHDAREQGRDGHQRRDQHGEAELYERQHPGRGQLQQEKRALADAVDVRGQDVLQVGLAAPDQELPFRPGHRSVESFPKRINEPQLHPGQKHPPLPRRRRAHRGEYQEHGQHRRQGQRDADGAGRLRQRVDHGTSDRTGTFSGRIAQADHVQQGHDHDDSERLGHAGRQQEQQRQDGLARRIGNQRAGQRPNVAEGDGPLCRGPICLPWEPS